MKKIFWKLQIPLDNYIYKHSCQVVFEDILSGLF